MAQTVLVVDDCRTIHVLLDARLQPEGLRLHHVYNAEEGYRQARQLKPDLILLDVDMPDQNGFVLCRRLKAEPETADLPIIFLTGSDDVTSKVRGFDLGAIDYVTKPFEPAELRARVRSALRTKRYQDMLATRAQLDALTGLWNRAHFEQRLREGIDLWRRHGHALCLLLIEVDDLRELNEQHGQPFADRMLQMVAECIAGHIRSTDKAFRFGGGQYAVILSEADLAGGLLLGQRLRERICALQVAPRKQQVEVSASFGVTASGNRDARQNLTPHELMVEADEALRAAKHAGRNHVFGNDISTRRDG